MPVADGIRIPPLWECEWCEGTGRNESTRTQCTLCGNEPGIGLINDRMCRRCNGTGSSVDSCSMCLGTGEDDDHKETRFPFE